MYKARQRLLANQTNIKLVDIRAAEIEYYASVMEGLGIQASFVGGFCYGVFILTEPSGEHYSASALTVYHIGSGICILGAVHAILITLLLMVMGPGLAINGPAGSMKKAAECMRAELGQVFGSFFIMMFGFALSTIMAFWAVMNKLPAFTSTAVFIFAIYCWWYYSRRIYLKLFYDASESNFKEERESELAPTGIPLTKNPPERISSNETALMEGYGSLKAVIDANDTKSGTSERLYFVLTNRGRFITFKSRDQYRKDTMSASNERPLVLNEYRLTFVPKPRMQDQNDLLLITRDDEVSGRKFLLSFDTPEEVKLWTDKLSETVPNLFK